MLYSTDLTARQREIYDWIRSQVRDRGYAPTVREIGDRFEISSPNGVICHLKAIEKRGFIKRDVGFSRAIALVEPESDRGLPFFPDPWALANFLRS